MNYHSNILLFMDKQAISSFEQVFIQYVKASPEIVGRKDHSHIGIGVLDGPCCKKGKLITLDIFGSRDPPIVFLGGAKKSISCAMA
jgi:hypothetical protein